MFHPTIFYWNNDRLILKGKHLKKLVTSPKALLWIRESKIKKIKSYRVIPIEIIRHKISLFTYAELNSSKCYLCFYWKEAIAIPNSTGLSISSCNGE